MKTLNINNLAEGGINTDLAPWDLGAQFFTDGKNFRIEDDKVCAVKSHLNWDDMDPAGQYAGRIAPILDKAWIVGGRDNIYAFDGGAWNDISPGSPLGYGVNGELDWSIGLLGKQLIVNNSNGYPAYGDAYTTPVSTLVGLPFDSVNTWTTKNYKCKAMRIHNNYVFALNLTEGANEFPNAYRWSHPADINGVPASWDETDVNYLAGREQTGGNYGDLVDGATLKDSFILYSTDGINALYPTNDEFVWRRKELSSTFGILSKDTIVEVEGSHFVLGDGDFIINRGSEPESIIYNKLKKRLNANLNTTYFDRSYAFANYIRKEIWFCVPEGATEYPNMAYVYNWESGKWALHEIPNGIAHCAYGLQIDAAVTYANVATVYPSSHTYDTTTLTYAGQTRSPLNNKVIGAENAGSADSLIIVDPAVSASNDTDAYIERDNLFIGKPEEIHTVTRVYPHFESTDPVDIKIGSQDRVNGAITWKGPYRFDPTTDRKIDTRVSGNLHAWRIDTVGTGTFEFKGMDVEHAFAGTR